MGTFCVVVGRNYSNPLRNVCCVQGLLGIQREFQFLFVRPGAPKFFEDSLDGDILRCCRQKLFKSTKKCLLCARFSWHPTGISVPFLCVFLASNENFTSFLCAPGSQIFEDALG
ncbi:hypothetical protein GQR58_026180 [Nymphon striatum]|nr:hypothetical protein GQR58_026180 [Nymphon striatum]